MRFGSTTGDHRVAIPLCLVALLCVGGLGVGPAGAEGTESQSNRSREAVGNGTAAPLADPTAHPVVVGIPDTGINPYHQLYYREGLDAHPSTYIEGYPADVPALELSVGGADYDTMFGADTAIWAGIEENTWYWIPETVFVAVYCSSGQSAAHRGQYCILDDGHSHGTGTTSSALMENPNALLAFVAGSSSIAPFLTGGIPVDVFSVSWGTLVPIPGHSELFCTNRDRAPLYVASAGNDPRSTLVDCWKGNPRIVSVGGAYAEGQSEAPLAAKQPDVVSYFCRPTAGSQTVQGMRPYCGTSFSGPTVAGALSKVIQAVRSDSGYRGSTVGAYLDPIAGFTISDLRGAMNRTASYHPEAQYGNSGGIPVNDEAPWLQWSWGFYDGLVADGTIAHLLSEPAPPKPLGATLYMEGLHLVKSTMHTHLPLPGLPDDPDTWPWAHSDAGSGRDAPDTRVPDVWITSGVAYHGTLAGGVSDNSDHYAFWGEAGDAVEAKGRGTFNRFAVFDPDGVRLGAAVSIIGLDAAAETSFTVTLEQTGVHYFQFRGSHPGAYALSIGINEEAPEPGFAGLGVPPPVPAG